VVRRAVSYRIPRLRQLSPIDFIRGPVIETLVQPPCVIPIKKLCEHLSRVSDCLICLQVYLVIFDDLLEMLNEDIVSPATLSVHAYFDAAFGKDICKLQGCKLAPPVGVLYIRCSIVPQCLFKSLYAEGSI
jgi:hypothetical protein